MAMALGAGASLRAGGGAGAQPAGRGVSRDPKRRRPWAEQGAERRVRPQTHSEGPG